MVWLSSDGTIATAWGHHAGKKRVVRLMRKMGLMPIYQRPNTSNPQPRRKIYPYLLRGVDITELG